MDKKSIYLFLLIALLIIVSVFSTYWKMVVIKDFEITDDLEEEYDLELETEIDF